MNNNVPEITGKLRNFMLKVPEEINACSGIRVFGKHIQSIIFTTDVSIIRNNNADAVVAVYPFTPQPIITRAIMEVADVPVFCGVGGGRTGGERAIMLAFEAEQQGALGVVFNAPTPNEIIRVVAEQIDIPVILTVISEFDDISERMAAGASILNVSGASRTPYIIEKIRKKHPEVPIIATGGPNAESIKRTVEAGANAITWTPPTSGEIFSDIMDQYRAGKMKPDH